MTEAVKIPSLRTQIIEAMRNSCCEYCGKEGTINVEAMFDNAIYPVLEKAMDAGALLVGRNTKDRIPVHKAVLDWLQAVESHVQFIERNESTVSKRSLLKVIYQLGKSASNALHDANKINGQIH